MKDKITPSLGAFPTPSFNEGNAAEREEDYLVAILRDDLEKLFHASNDYIFCSPEQLKDMNITRESLYEKLYKTLCDIELKLLHDYKNQEDMMISKKEQISTIYLDIYKDLKAVGLSIDEAANVRAAIKDGKIRHVKIVEE